VRASAAFRAALRAAFPGTFDPLTVAHVAVAEAARHQLAVDVVDLVLSRVPLGKQGEAAPVEQRERELRALTTGRSWLATRITDDQLLADIARGYDVLVIGADKWHQLRDVSFYGGSSAARDAALDALPHLAVAPRSGWEVPAGPGITVLSIPHEHRDVSSTAVRAGREEWRARPR
jgi:hypothetical protein